MPSLLGLSRAFGVTSETTSPLAFTHARHALGKPLQLTDLHPVQAHLRQVRSEQVGHLPESRSQ